jgi:hypothetical protein
MDNYPKTEFESVIDIKNRLFNSMCDNVCVRYRKNIFLLHICKHFQFAGQKSRGTVLLFYEIKRRKIKRFIYFELYEVCRLKEWKVASHGIN